MSVGRCGPTWLTDHSSAVTALTTQRGLRASAMQSKAGPRFAVVAGADADDQSLNTV
jgi:hypothetical protein